MRVANPRFCELSNLIAYLGAQPAGVNPVLPLYPLGSDGNDSNRIGHWGQDAHGFVVTQGPINLTRLSDSRSGLASGTAGAVVALTAGHNITRTSGTVRAWDRTGASELGDYTYTRAGDNLTIGAVGAAVVQARLTAGAVVEMIDVGVCELCIGGATRVIRPLALGVGSVVHGVGIRGSGNVTIFPGWSPAAANEWFLRLTVSYARSATAALQQIKFASWQSSLKHVGSGLHRNAVNTADLVRPTYGAIAAPVTANLVDDDGAGATYPFTSMRLTTEYSGGVQYQLGLMYPTLRRTILAGELTAPPTGVLIRTVQGAAETLSGSIAILTCG